jgi:hypothetical protein
MCVEASLHKDVIMHFLHSIPEVNPKMSTLSNLNNKTNTLIEIQTEKIEMKCHETYQNHSQVLRAI